ncbi:MAG TPA: hypothetical protein VFA32_22550 [Dehalococcoidia bacterium]|jgi:hypothetical protein|nr:hypothetical protein [Dehalococcoidia bacterium]
MKAKAPPTTLKAKPWDRYREDSSGPGQGSLQWKLLQPGWAGHLDEDELAFIVEHLKEDGALRLRWGIRPSWRRIPEEVVRRIAMEGDPDNQGHNRKLARPRQQSRPAA